MTTLHKKRSETLGTAYKITFESDEEDFTKQCRDTRRPCIVRELPNYLKRLVRKIGSPIFIKENVKEKVDEVSFLKCCIGFLL